MRTQLTRLGKYTEKLHLAAASAQWLGLYHFEQPLGGWIEGYVIVPLATFGFREVWPRAFRWASYGFNGCGRACVVLSEVPETVGRQLMVASRKLGKLLVKFGGRIQQIGRTMQRSNPVE